MAKQQEKEPVEVPLHELYPPVELQAKGGSPAENQGNLIAARNSPGYLLALGITAQALAQRADQILLDYTREMVAVRNQIDGLWHQLDPRDRPSGDAMLFAYKKLANLNPDERRAKQEGTFNAKFQKTDYIFTLVSQGTPTGERVLMKIRKKKPTFERLEELGMREKVRLRVKEILDGDGGLSVFSAPPSGGGMSTLWTIGLNATDRYVRDFVSLEDKNNPEDEVINITPHFFDGSKGESPATLVPRLLLKEPDVFVVPEMVNVETVKLMCEQATKYNRPIITRVHAKETAEAILRMMMYKAPAKELAAALALIVNERLVRRLCAACKQAYQPAPQLLQRLGIPAGRVQMFYREYQPPPPEELVDEKGNPIEPPVCQECHGLGYKGRIGIFEVCVVDDGVRQAMLKQPTLESLRQAVRQSGCRSLQEEGILLVAQGITSLTELQRALKQ